MSESREKYTSAQVVSESLVAGTGNVVAWTPVVHEVFEDALGVKFDAKVLNGTTETLVYINDADGKFYTDAAYTTEYTAVAGDKVAYKYDNIQIPQAKLPTLVAQMDTIALSARARRIAIRYSQIAAFQAKTDYGMDMAGELARQAVKLS